jgi:anti-sigma regulatory factor (Ser/Thr protein kinase)
MLIPVTEPSQAGDARRRAIALAEDLRLDEGCCGAVALAATEMATNLVKHAGGGHLLLQRVGTNGSSGIRIISVDKGPGIRDIGSALSDGHSTSGTLGSGLGAIQRASSGLHLYSMPHSGAVVSAEFYSREAKHSSNGMQFEIGFVSEPIAGEDVCGDGWAGRPFRDGLRLMVVDGLGHGVLAADAAREAERIFDRSQHESLTMVLQDTNLALRKTRGAAFGLAQVNLERGLLSFVGVGNVATSVVAPGVSRSLASHNGILGQHMERVQEFTVPWNENSVLVMHSDGLGSRWDLDRYPGIWSKHPAVIAALLHRDFCRGRDDVTVVVAKRAAAG